MEEDDDYCSATKTSGDFDIILRDDFKEYESLFFKWHFNPNEYKSDFCQGLSELTFVCKITGSVLFTRGLLEMGAKIHNEDENGFQPIHAAARGGKLACLDEMVYYVEKITRDFQRRLLSNLDAYKERGEPIALKIPRNHFQGDFIVRDGKEGKTALHWAAMDTNNCEPVILCTVADTLLRKANKDNHIDIMQYLFDHGAEIDTRDNEGNMPLHFAGTAKAAFHLLYQGARIHELNGKGERPLECARNRFWKERNKVQGNPGYFETPGRGFGENMEEKIAVIHDFKYVKFESRKKVHKRSRNREKEVVQVRKEFIQLLELATLKPQWDLVQLNQLRAKLCKTNNNKTSRQMKHIERKILNFETTESLYVNKLLLENLTSYYLCKFKRETDDLVLFSRIRENLEFLAEMFGY